MTHNIPASYDELVQHARDDSARSIQEFKDTQRPLALVVVDYANRIDTQRERLTQVGAQAIFNSPEMTEGMPPELAALLGTVASPLDRVDLEMVAVGIDHIAAVSLELADLLRKAAQDAPEPPPFEEYIEHITTHHCTDNQE